MVSPRLVVSPRHQQVPVLQRRDHPAGGAVRGSHGPRISVSGCVYDKFIGWMLSFPQRPECPHRFADVSVDGTCCFVSGECPGLHPRWFRDGAGCTSVDRA